MTKEYTTSIKRMSRTKRQRIRQRDNRTMKLTMPADLMDFLRRYSGEHCMNATGFLRRYVRQLRQAERGKRSQAEKDTEEFYRRMLGREE